MQLRRRNRRTLVASAAKLRASSSNNAQGTESWQERALRHYDNTGEVRFCAQFYARMLARVRYYPATINDDGTTEPLDDEPAVRLLSRVQDPGGGRQRLQYNYGRLMFVTGEGALFVSNPETNRERWRFLWRGELETDDKTKLTYRKDAQGERITSEPGTAYRMWTSHPGHTEKADSPVRPILDIADELTLLTAAVRSTATTRLLNGILVLPSEAEPPPLDPGQDEDIEESPFLSMLTQHIVAQIENPGQAEAKAPFLLVAGYEYLDQVRWMQMHDPASDYLERDLRIEAIKRMALGLDLPPEALLGLTDANHWTGQQVQWDMWRSHGIPIADQFAADLNDVYLRPALAEEGYDASDVVVAYDDSQVVVSPDRTAIADEAMDRVAVSFEGYRLLKGIPEDMAPSEEEKKFIAGIKMRDPVVAGLEKEAPPVRGPQPGPAVAQPGGQPGTPPQPTAGRVVSRQEARTASILGAAQLALRQCRAKAGARLRTQVSKPSQRCSECEQTIDGIPNAVVASALGVDMLRELSLHDPITLVRGGTDDFKGILSEWGVDVANGAVLCERIEAYAARTLFDPNTPDLPPGFAAHVEHALEVAENALVNR